MIDSDLLAKITAIESFVISPDNQFGIIADVLDGEPIVGAYIWVPLNSTISLTVKIDEIKDIRIAGNNEPYKLLLCNDPDDYNASELLHGLNIGSEELEIRKSGDD